MFRFKREKVATGNAGVGNPYPNTVIKVENKQVGTIVAPNWRSKDNLWHVRFAVKCETGWKWITLKEKFEEETLAREYIQANVERILTQNNLELFQFEDD